MEKYYFKTKGYEPDIECVTPCWSKKRPSDGVRIGSAACQDCVCHIENDMDEYGCISWLKCSDILNAIGE
jgi:hypothetical protein